MVSLRVEEERPLGFLELWERWGQAHQRQCPLSRRSKRKFILGFTDRMESSNRMSAHTF
jgi:hypothetical protein